MGEITYKDVSQYTQGRSLKEAQIMAEDLVAMWAEELQDPELANAVVTFQVEGEIMETANAARKASQEAEQARQCARQIQAETVRTLLNDGLTMQDIAQVLGVTKGHVSQIAKAA